MELQDPAKNPELASVGVSGQNGPSINEKLLFFGSSVFRNSELLAYAWRKLGSAKRAEITWHTWERKKVFLSWHAELDTSQQQKWQASRKNVPFHKEKRMGFVTSRTQGSYARSQGQTPRLKGHTAAGLVSHRTFSALLFSRYWSPHWQTWSLRFPLHQNEPGTGTTLVPRVFWAAKSLWFFTTFSNRSQKSHGSAMATKCFRNWETNGGICDSSGISKVILYIFYVYPWEDFHSHKATSYEFFLVHWKYPKLELENFGHQTWPHCARPTTW